MNRWVVDTNVPVVANGRNDNGRKRVSPSCQKSTITFLMELHASGKILLDRKGEMQKEYRRYLNPKGQPGVGDRFYQSILQRPDKIERFDLDKNAAGEYIDLLAAIVGAGFDPDDRKFAAMSVKEGVPVVNATDSDWAKNRALLEASGIQIRFLCGCAPAAWYE
ncbi:MAG: hypothetical protein GDA53_08910 [Rhodobacteraceae bacterium]|nr:hypothetical protein [Paracoccaceae bacterium]